MSRRIENHEILQRGSGEINFLKNVEGTRKIITSRETIQKLLLTTPILISANIFSYGDIHMEATSIVHFSIAILLQFWLFFFLTILHF